MIINRDKGRPVPFAAMATSVPVANSAGSRRTRSYRWPTLAELWAFLGLALPALAALLVPMPAVDLAYQLRAGASILGGAGIPAVDTWTYTVAGEPWLDQQWGAQVLLGAAFQVGGWTGLAILRAALVATTFGLVQATLRSMGCAARPAALLALGSFAIAAPALAPRPQLFAIVLFAAATFVVADRRAHPRRLWLLPVFTALWANLHGSFPLVLVIVGLGWLAELIRRRLEHEALRRLPKGVQPPPPAGAGSRLLGSTGIALIGAVTAVATLANPFGVEAWQYVVRLASNPAVSSQVSEWRPPSPIEPAGAVFYLSLLIAIAVIALRVRADGGRVGLPILAPVAALLAFGTLGVLTGRGLAWWALVLPINAAAVAHDANLTRVLPRLLEPIGRLLTGPPGGPGRPSRADRTSPLNFAVGLVLVGAAVALLPVWRPLGAAGVPVGTLSYAPQGIAAHLALRAPALGTGQELRVWSPQTWGSWLELSAPAALFATDSRVELFSTDVWSETQQIATGTGDWKAALIRDRVYVIVVAADQQALRRALGGWTLWHQVYEDVDGSIWIRSDVILD